MFFDKPEKMFRTTIQPEVSTMKKTIYTKSAKQPILHSTQNRWAKSLYESLNHIGRRAKIFLPAALVLGISMPAHALKISSITDSWGPEISSVINIVLLLVAAFGVGIGSWAVVSLILDQKKGQPATWQWWGIIGGSAAIVMPLLIAAVSGTLTDEQGNAAGVFNDLGIN